MPTPRGQAPCPPCLHTLQGTARHRDQRTQHIFLLLKVNGRAESVKLRCYAEFHLESMKHLSNALIVPKLEEEKGHGTNRIGGFCKRKIPLFPWAFKQGALTRSDLILRRRSGTCHHEAVTRSCGTLGLSFRSLSTSPFSALHTCLCSHGTEPSHGEKATQEQWKWGHTFPSHPSVVWGQEAKSSRDTGTGMVELPYRVHGGILIMFEDSTCELGRR